MSEEQRQSEIPGAAKLAEEAMRENAERYRAIFEQSPIAIELYDAAGTLASVNPACLELFGVTDLQEIHGFALFEDPSLPDEFREKLRCGEIVHCQTALDFEQIHKLNLYHPKRAGILWLDILITPLGQHNDSAGGYLMQIQDITERKQTEDALRESEEKLSLFMRYCPNPVYIKDENTRTVVLSHHFEKMLGKPLSQLLGKTSEELWPPELAAGMRADDEKVLKEGRILEREETFNGRHYLSVKFPISVLNHPTILGGYTIDITERKQAEDALRESEEKYRLLAEHTSDIVWLMDMDMKTTYHSPSSEKLRGFTDQEIKDLPLEKNLAPESLQLALGVLFREMPRIEADPSYNPVTNLELEYYHKDGSTFWLENKFSIIRDSSGKPVSILGEGRDISERKRVQDALRESEDKYRKLFEMESDALFLTDAQSGQILDANMAAVALYGYSLDELLGMRNVDLSAEPEKTKESSALASSSGVIAIPLRYHRKKDGTVFPVEINATSIVWNGRLAFIPVIRDITERRELEERIRQVRSDLLFAVSHDLKSPLQALHQTQEMLNELTPGEGLARFQEYSEIWRRNLQRLERMINNLMDSQRGEEGRFPLLLAPSNPVELIKRVVEDSQGFALSSQVSFDLKLQPVPEGVCDEEALARVVENLLTNAVKFSPKGGKVEVRLEMEGDALLLEVEDHGFGIPALEQAQLFQPFQRGRTAERKGIRGTGLGLYVCRRIVEEHGGSISLFSEEGKGTKVTVRLPWRIIGT